MKNINPCLGCDGRCCKGLTVILTVPEALTLLKKTKLRPEQILEFSCQIDPNSVPHYPILVKQKNELKQYFIIIKRAKKCIFLDENNKCKIYENRPNVCRIYPFELDGKTLRERYLCAMAFKKTGEIENSAQELQSFLKLHGIVIREWNVKNSTQQDFLDIKNFLEYFEEITNIAAKKYKISLPK